MILSDTLLDRLLTTLSDSSSEHVRSFGGNRCGADSPRSRALSLGAGQLFFNFWVALRHELPYHFDHTGLQLTGLDVLHGLREADFEEAQPSKHL